MKLLLLLLLLQQPQFYNNRIIDNGCTIQDWNITKTEVNIFATTTKGDQYIDLCVHVPHDTIIGSIYIFTNRGNWSIPQYKIKKSGFVVYRLFFRQKDQWQSFDTGIWKISVKTRKKLYNMYYNNYNLKQLKQYANDNANR